MTSRPQGILNGGPDYLIVSGNVTLYEKPYSLFFLQIYHIIQTKYVLCTYDHEKIDSIFQNFTTFSCKSCHLITSYWCVPPYHDFTILTRFLLSYFVDFFCHIKTKPEIFQRRTLLTLRHKCQIKIGNVTQIQVHFMYRFPFLKNSVHFRLFQFKQD